MKQGAQPESSGAPPGASISRTKRRLRMGYVVFIGLVAIKLIEWLVVSAVRAGAWPYLLILALVSAGLIAYYYKHIDQLWYKEKHDE